jgi:CDP-glucose 4,6-dehydratase
MGGHDPYSASKGAAELVTGAYRSSFFNDPAGAQLASVRAGNVIGGGDWSKYRLVPDIVRAFAKGENVRLRHPNAVRAWQHVLDPLRGYLMLAEKLCEAGGAYAHGWNFGPDASEIHSVEQTTKKIASLWGGGASYSVENTASPHEAGLLLLDSSLAGEKLGWKPKLSFDQTIEWLTEWYRAFYSGKQDMRALTAAQIERFEKM